MIKRQISIFNSNSPKALKNIDVTLKQRILFTMRRIDAEVLLQESCLNHKRKLALCQRRDDCSIFKNNIIGDFVRWKEMRERVGLVRGKDGKHLMEKEGGVVIN